MPVHQRTADDYLSIQPAVQPSAGRADNLRAESGIRGARFVSRGGPRAEMEQLADRIAELSARIQAATYELLVLIHQFDQREGWSGFTSCAHWLSWRAGLAPGAAREHVRVARALADLHRLSDAMRHGRISYSKVRAVTRVATPETEQTLLDVALAGTAAHVEQVVRAWRRVDRAAEATDDRRRHASRVLHTWVDDDGMVVIRGRLTPEVGAVVRRALEAALDEERRAAAAARSADEPDPVDEAVGVAPSFGQRQADALGTWWPSAPWPADSPAAPRATATRSWCTSTPARSQKMLTFPRERPGRRSAVARSREHRRAVRDRGGLSAHAVWLRSGRQRWKKRAAFTSQPQPHSGWPATPPSSRCGMARTGRCSTSAASPARYPLPCAALWPRATGSAAFLDARPAAAMPITFGTGRMAGRPRSTISFCCAAATTERCTKRGSGSPSTRAARRRSCGRMGARCPQYRPRRTGPACRWSRPWSSWRQPAWTSTGTPPRRRGAANGWT